MMEGDWENDERTERVIGAAIRVHQELGPGLLESTYESCLSYELAQDNFKIERQKDLPVIYRGVSVNCGYRVDLVIDDEIIIELKTVDKFLPIHFAQLISYLKHSGCRKGLLINFNVLKLKDGIRRLVI